MSKCCNTLITVDRRVVCGTPFKQPFDIVTSDHPNVDEREEIEACMLCDECFEWAHLETFALRVCNGSAWAPEVRNG